MNESLGPGPMYQQVVSTNETQQTCLWPWSGMVWHGGNGGKGQKVNNTCQWKKAEKPTDSVHSKATGTSWKKSFIFSSFGQTATTLKFYLARCVIYLLLSAWTLRCRCIHNIMSLDGSEKFATSCEECSKNPSNLLFPTILSRSLSQDAPFKTALCSSWSQIKATTLMLIRWYRCLARSQVKIGLKLNKQGWESETNRIKR